MKRLLSAILILAAVMSSYGGNTSSTGEIEVQYYSIPDALGIFSEVADADPVVESEVPLYLPSSAGKISPTESDESSDSDAEEPSDTLASTITSEKTPTTPPSDVVQQPSSELLTVADPSPAPEAEPNSASEPPTQRDSSVPVPEVSVPSCPEPEPTNEPELQPDPASTQQPRSIYDYPFDMDAIRAELISLGESAGIAHVTTDDGRVITPDTASWGNPITASQRFQGDALRRRLHELVTSMPGIITSYGGEALTQFTIYIEPQAEGSYKVYYLY